MKSEKHCLAQLCAFKTTVKVYEYDFLAVYILCGFNLK